MEHKDNRLTIQIEPSLELRARKAGDAMGESVSAIVRAALREYLDRFDCNQLSAFAKYEAIQEPSHKPSTIEDKARVIAMAMHFYEQTGKLK